MNGHPEKPTLLWDGECGFCARWIRRWNRLTGDAVDYRVYQDALDEFPQIDEDACRRAVQLILPDGRVYSAAHAVLRAMNIGGRDFGLLFLYQRCGFFRRLAEAAYRFVARHRDRMPQL